MQWIVPKELDDGREVTDRRSGCVAFPVGNRDFVNPNLLGNLPLEALEVQSTTPDVVA